MLNTVLTDDRNIAGFYWQQSIGEDSISADEEAQSQASPIANSWFLSTGNPQNAHVYLESILSHMGATRKLPSSSLLR
jgi:hypothetical protein